MAVLLSACSTMSVNECKLANWQDVGLRDGLAGAEMKLLDERIKDCAEALVPVDTTAYLRGRDQGLASYCRLDNAVRQGVDGKGYAGVCPPQVDAEFRRRWQAGMDLYRARADLASMESRRRSLEHRLREAPTDDERTRARNDLSELDWRMRAARDHVRDAEWALDRLR